MKLRGRDWAFWLQAVGLVCIWAAVSVIAAWFVWRGYELHRRADAWKTTIVVGSLVSTVFFICAGVLTYLFVNVGADDSPGPEVPHEISPTEESLTHGVLQPWSGGMKAAVALLAAFTGFAMFYWYRQLSQGLVVTGLKRPVFWGMYITNFVFFVGMSYGGTLVSAILRLASGEWRRPITRAAEAAAVILLCIGGWNVFLDLGRPDRAWKLFVWGRMQSPLMWDVIAMTTYLALGVLYLYLPLIPDLALLRHRVTGWRKPLYHLLAFGWTGTKKQFEALERVISIVAVVIIPVAVSVHSVLAWVFSMTIQPMWHSSIFGPYFVLGAMFSGVAALVIVLAITRQVLHLEKFLQPVHFKYLGGLLIMLSLFWVYFTGSELLTVYYGDEPREMAVLLSKMTGAFEPLTIVMFLFCFIVPVGLLAFRRTIRTTVIASVAIVIGMWIERFTIVVPTLVQPSLPYPVAHYTPDVLEFVMLFGCISLFGLLYLIFARLFPIVSVWEMTEGRETAAGVTASRIRSYFPADHAGELEPGAVAVPAAVPPVDGAAQRPIAVDE